MNKSKKAWQAKKKQEKELENNPIAFKKISGVTFLTPYKSRVGKHGKGKPKHKDHR